HWGARPAGRAEPGHTGAHEGGLERRPGLDLSSGPVHGLAEQQAVEPHGPQIGDEGEDEVDPGSAADLGYLEVGLVEDPHGHPAVDHESDRGKSYDPFGAHGVIGSSAVSGRSG